MSKVVKKVLLAGDKLMPETYLRHFRFMCSVCGPFTKSNKKT